MPRSTRLRASSFLAEAGESARSVSLSDTVGFIRDLPHKLIEAFEATLQEANDADLLLHVVDAASPVLTEQMSEVQRVLAEIGANDIPQMLVFNKLDQLEETQRPRVLRDTIEVAAGVRVPRVFISAQSGEGMPELRAILAEAVAAMPTHRLKRDESTQDVGWSDDEFADDTTDVLPEDTPQTDPHLSPA